MDNSILNKDAGLDVSDKYKVIKTGDVVDRLEYGGWTLREKTEQRYKNKMRVGYGQHVIKLIHPDLPFVNGHRPEVVLKNSYDGSSSYTMFFGIFRLVCSNGLVVGSAFEGLRVRHVGNDVVQRVLESADHVKDSAGRMMRLTEQMREVYLTDEKRVKLYHDAEKLVLPNGAISKIPYSIARSRRSEDLSSDLWTTYNRIQENAIQGGIRYIKLDPDTNEMLRGTTRRITNIQRNIETNRALWNLATSYMEGAM